VPYSRSIGLQSRLGAKVDRRGLTLVCAIAVAAGMQLGAAQSAVASPVTDWGSQALEPASSIQDGIIRLRNSAGVMNLKGVKAACQQIQGSAEDLRALLPAPSEALTDTVSAALSELRMGIRPCLKLGPSDRPGGRSIVPNQNDISTADMHLDKAIGYMESAVSMVQGG
jgi:hypothetical protein